MRKHVNSIGIDVSKASLSVCLAKDVSTINDSAIYEFPNLKTGISSLISKLTTLKVAKDTPIIIESTGDFHILATTLLLEARWNVKLINPIIVSQFARKQIRKQKSDNIDARILAKIGLLQANEINTPSFKRELVIARKKVNLINKLKKQKQSVSLQFKNFAKFNKDFDIEVDNSLNLLEKVVKQLDLAIKLMEKEIINLTQDAKEIELITHIDGISKVSASQLVVILKERDFQSKKQLTAFVGLDITTKLSGTSIHKHGKISKRGTAAARRILFNMAWGVCRHNEKFQSMYNYYKAKGRHHFECLIIIARKLLHIFYGMWRTKTEFKANLINY
jgi:transposase